MLSVLDLENAVTKLKNDDMIEFRKWFIEYDFKNWDEEIAYDYETGKLDFLIDEALNDYKSHKNT
jgi:hypothetical protein